nr:TonB-dependent receptor [Endozoicomonas sp. OPT23]
MAQAEEAIKLDSVVVTASRTAQSIDETLAPVTVITRQDIERKQATSVTELLSTVPGVSVTTNGGPGSRSSVSIRGTVSRQTLVLVDGQRINSATSGEASFQYLDPDQIEKIEVVRGPRSSLYGADALGGVIQIFTRNGLGKPSLRVRAGTGSRKTNELGVSYGGTVDKTKFFVGANLFETAGYNFSNKDGYISQKGANLDDDAYRNKSINASLSHEYDFGLEVGVKASHRQGKNEFDNSTTDYYHQQFKASILSLHASLPINDLVTSRFDAGYSNNEATDYISGRKDDLFGTSRISASLLNDIFWADNQMLTAGVDYYKDKIDTTDKFENKSGKKENSRYNYAAFVQNQSSFDSSDFLISLRSDKSEVYGSNLTGNVSFGIELPRNMRVIASYGKAFRAPTFNDLYFPKTTYPSGYKYVGNPDVKPEKADNYDLELRGKTGLFNWSAVLFENNIEDLIATEPGSDGFNTPTNINKAKIRGLELSLSVHIKEWTLNTSYSLVDPKDTETDKVLAKRAKQQFAFDADRAFGKLSVGGTLRAQSDSYTNSSNTQELAGFATVDFRSAYKFDNELKVEVKLVNALDKSYQTAKGYTAEPRGTFVTFIWTPQL